MNTKRQLDSEKLLFKLILQFSIYTRGSNKLLDPHLINISKEIKQGKNFLDLSGELASLSKTLMHISNATVEEKIEISHKAPTELNQRKYFVAQLERLLVETEIPLKFQKQCQALKSRFKNSLDDQAYKQIIDSTISMLVKIKNYVIGEQKEMENFLADITNQLNILEGHAVQVSDNQKQARESRNLFSDSIDQQVDNIKQSSEQATELPSLQNTINEYLQELSLQLIKYKEADESLHMKSQEKLDSMSERLQDLEQEAECLRQNLKVAHDNAQRDTLTGLPNRLAYEERLKLEMGRWKRHKQALSLIIWDIDFFKSINDTFGHKAGDNTLVLVAQLIQKGCRKTDFVARFGGEEFIMLLSETNVEQAKDLAEKIRLNIEKSGFNHHGKSISLTISAGISEFIDGDSDDGVFERADKALYQSKQEGRNRCIVG